MPDTVDIADLLTRLPENLRNLLIEHLAEEGLIRVVDERNHRVALPAGDEPGGVDGDDFTLRRPRFAAPALMQVRVDLKGAKPPLWRRLVFRSDLDLETVHQVLVAVFGWDDDHLHQFWLGKRGWGEECEFYYCWQMEEGSPGDGVPDYDVSLDEVLQDPGDKLFYEYDFGSSWPLILKLEKLLPWDADAPAAICTGGRQAIWSEYPDEDEDGDGDGGYVQIPFDPAEVSDRLARIPVPVPMVLLGGDTATMAAAEAPDRGGTGTASEVVLAPYEAAHHDALIACVLSALLAEDGAGDCRECAVDEIDPLLDGEEGDLIPQASIVALSGNVVAGFVAVAELSPWDGDPVGAYVLRTLLHPVLGGPDVERALLAAAARALHARGEERLLLRIPSDAPPETRALYEALGLHPVEP